MGPAKAKQGVRSSGWKLAYVVMSMIISVISLSMASAFSATNPYEYLTRYQIEIAVFLMGLLPTLLQVVLIERFLKQSMRGWLASTAIGTFITLLILGTVTRWSDNLAIVQIVGTLIVFGPKTVLQTVWLWRRFHKAWLWPLLILSAEYIIQVLLNSLGNTSATRMIFTILPIIVAAVQALLLYHLLAQPKGTEKAKIDYKADEQSNHERIQRLQEKEHTNPLWDIGDDQALQSEA